ncbi:amidohydrolase family protein [Pseudonocardia sp. EV170527-09]|uniref:amidohydrolase family protein n=1 Tax=Pseudonocardia sp. EV170527-09 TaxID=2603411 RepID=UPI0011F35F17|nr:amidohydrolase family protein [Pseudonocardia sp. EV170527-09]
MNAARAEIFVADRLISRGREHPEGGDAVRVSQGQIDATGRADELIASDPEATVSRFAGHSIMPGLINSHVHLGGDCSKSSFDVLCSGAPDDVRALIRANARSCLRAGCTTVRDLGDAWGYVARFRDSDADADSVRPTVLSAGTPLTITGGHCWYLGGIADSAAEIRSAIDRSAGDVDLIKIMAGGGYMTPEGPTPFDAQYSTELIGVAVEHASRYGLQVAAHAHGTEPIVRCIEAGVSTIEHCGWRSGPGQRDQNEAAVRKMAQQKTAAGDTTPAVWRGIAKYVTTPEYKFGSQLTWMAENDVRILIGTDSGVPGTEFDQLKLSMELYEELGFARGDIIDMVTMGAAEALGIGHKTGDLRAGMAADLLIVAGNPLNDLDCLHRPERVIAQGVVYSQQDLGDEQS